MSNKIFEFLKIMTSTELDLPILAVLTRTTGLLGYIGPIAIFYYIANLLANAPKLMQVIWFIPAIAMNRLYHDSYT